jgi:dihydroorotate dehydrogenase electron transfer subunit
VKEVYINVKENIELVKGSIHKIVFVCPDLPEFQPGQFINLAVGNYEYGALLRRPISVFKHDAAAKTFEIVFEVKGKGTKFFSRLKGGFLPATLFLGNGFTLPAGTKKVALIGGGMGCPPLYSVIEKYKKEGIKFYTYLGFSSRVKAVCLEDFASVSDKLTVATDDGSIGEKDFITNVFARDVEKIKPDVILSCGPMPMFRSLKALKLDIPTYISMEARMGCGIGACYVCACATISGNRRVCRDGTVFDIKEVLL